MQALSSIFIMFVIQWVYAVANIGVALLLFLYIGKTNPGLPPGHFFYSILFILLLLFSYLIFYVSDGFIFVKCLSNCKNIL